MNKFKKVLAGICSVCILFSNAVLCHADGAESAEQFKILQKPAQNSIVVSGEIEDSRTGGRLTLSIFDESDNIVFVDKTNTFAKNSKTVFEFSETFLPNDLSSGVYTVNISSNSFSQPLTNTFRYYSFADKYGVLVEADNASAVGTIVLTDDNDKILGVDKLKYEALSENGMTIFEGVMSEAEYDLPDSYEGTEDDHQKITAALDKFQTEYLKACATGEFADIDNQAESKAWFDRYYSEYSFDSDTAITEIYEKVKAEKEFTDRIIAKTDAASLDEIKDYVYRSTLLSAIVSRTDAEVRDIILDFSEYFSIERTKYNALSSQKKTKLISEISGTHYDTCDEATEDINKKIEKYGSTTGGNSNTGGGGSGSGSRESVSFPPATAVAEKPLFSDIEDAAWAKEAIEFFANKGILSGKGDGRVAPNDNVSRAEFAKLLVSVMGVKMDASQNPFRDVDNAAWYAPYVAAAYVNGIILGDESRKFNPDASITRQDMAVMIFRAMKIGEVASKGASFADSGLISDYAKNAVAYLSSNGIINGMGNGKFAPLNSATRAETVVMLYRIINK